MFACRRLCAFVNKSLFHNTTSVLEQSGNFSQPSYTKFGYLAKFGTMFSPPKHVTHDYGTFIVELIPALKDNYMYVVIDKESSVAAAVDPVEPDKIIERVKAHNATLKFILTTHHHDDHAGGNMELCRKVPDVVVYAGGYVEAIDKILEDNATFTLGEKTTVTVIHTPCHTLSSVCYHVHNANYSADVVFTGDTLFVAGAGKFIEGNGTDMNDALNRKLAALDDDCKVFCGHEYTVNNLQFAILMEDTNGRIRDKLKWAKETRSFLLPTVPSTIREEKATNPFMRVDCMSAILQKCGNDPNKVMDFLREKKNNFPTV